MEAFLASFLALSSASRFICSILSCRGLAVAIRRAPPLPMAALDAGAAAAGSVKDSSTSSSSSSLSLMARAVRQG